MQVIQKCLEKIINIRTIHKETDHHITRDLEVLETLEGLGVREVIGDQGVILIGVDMEDREVLEVLEALVDPDKTGADLEGLEVLEVMEDLEILVDQAQLANHQLHHHRRLLLRQRQAHKHSVWIPEPFADVCTDTHMFGSIAGKLSGFTRHLSVVNP